jgi:hypothetical protein
LVLDSLTCMVSLPPVRKQFVKKVVSELYNKHSVTIKEMQQAVGFLNYASRAVYGGRTFVRRMINAVTEHIAAGKKFIRISNQIRLDLEWWVDFMDVWEGHAIFLEPLPVALVDFQTDASGNPDLGAGAFYDGEGLQERWAPEVQERILAKELYSPHLEVYPMLMAARKWGSRWSGKHLIVFSDNTGAIAAINKGSVKNELVMSWLRELFWLSATHSFRVTARKIPGPVNKLADALSRFQDEEYMRYLLLWRAAKRGSKKVLDSNPWLKELFELNNKAFAIEAVDGGDRP